MAKDIETIKREDNITINHKLQAYKVGRFTQRGFSERDLSVYRYVKTTKKNGKTTTIIKEGFCWPIDLREFKRDKLWPHPWSFALDIHAHSKKTGRILKQPFHVFLKGKGRIKNRALIHLCYHERSVGCREI